MTGRADAVQIREVLFLAFESLVANKLRSTLTMLGMIIGVGAVVLLVSVGNGARNYVLAQFQSMGSNIISIQPGRTDKGGPMGHGPPGLAQRPLTNGDVEALEKQARSLDGVAGLLFGAASVKRDVQTSNINIIGTSDKLFSILTLKVYQGVTFTREESETGRRVILLGTNVAKNLFGEDNALNQLVRVNESDFRVIGILTPMGDRMGFSMDNMAIIPTKAAMRLFNEDKLLSIRAKAKSNAALDEAVEEIKAIIKQRHNNQDDITIVTQVSVLDTMNTILGMLTLVLGAIAMISMVVGGIGIMNIMLVSVTERTREIGIRRAVGARRRDILIQFLAEAIVLSLTAGMLGLLGSVFITYVVSWIVPSFDMRAPAWIMIPAFLLSFGTGVTFGVWPARRASMIETIDALRYE